MKIVLITGTSRGIGSSIAEEFKKQSYYVIGVSTQNNKLSFEDEHYAIDLSNTDQLEELCKSIEAKPVDVLINNAGINYPQNFLDIDTNTFVQTLQVNLHAPFRLCQTVIPNMLIKNYGRIVNVASIWSKKSRAGVAAYSASKFGLDGMTLSIAHEYSKFNILANCLSPGFTNTEMTQQNLTVERIKYYESVIPENRLAQPSEIAKTVYWLGSEMNTYITGQNLAVDGGFTRA